MRTGLLWLLCLSGCALDAGEGFAVLDPSVSAAYTPQGSRDAGDGFQRLSSDYQVRVGAASLHLGNIELLGSSGGAGPTTFDPANPPPGYTLCHGGHCHRDDGALISYEDIEAELGGGPTTAPVATLTVNASMNLLAPETHAVGCEPDCELPKTTLTRGRWSVTSLALEGTVRDGRQPARFSGERRFSLVLSPNGALPALVLDGPLDVPSDREHAPVVTLDLGLPVPPSVFDTVDWGSTTLDSNGVADLNAQDNTPARTALVEKLVALQPEAEVERHGR
ncbi:hypothetical protein P2318_21380 [Myxococcaceae bacterium GXIMD 01537]